MKWVKVKSQFGWNYKGYPSGTSEADINSGTLNYWYVRQEGPEEWLVEMIYCHGESSHPFGNLVGEPFASEKEAKEAVRLFVESIG